MTDITEQRADLGPFLTGEYAPIGGEIKRRPEDFLVEEIPSIDPSGEGDHTYLFVEKTDRTTEDVAKVLARHFRVRRRDVGTAGRKDKRAITRQVFSVHTPGKAPEDFPDLRVKNIAVLWVDLHTHKLRTGQLSANRFSIRVRGVDPLRVLDAHKMVAKLAKEGVPNAFGEQRFGAKLNNHLVARHIVRSEWDLAVDALIRPAPGAPADDPFARAHALLSEGKLGDAAGALPKSFTPEIRLLRALEEGASPQNAVAALPVKHADFLMCALQSAIFNGALADRLIDGSFDADADAPLIGPSCGQIDDATQRVLDRAGITVEGFNEACARYGLTLPGGRRALGVRMGDPEVEGGADEQGGFIRLAFDLPPGGYATSVLREICKNAPLIAL